MKKMVFRSVVVAFTIIIAIGMSAYCCIATHTTATQFAEGSEYIIKNKVCATDVMKEAYGDGLDAVHSFYTGYAFENPNFTEGEFYSEMINAKGEVVASYKPFIVVKGETKQGVEDTRFILWDEKATITYESNNGTGTTFKIEGEDYTTALYQLDACVNAHKNSDFYSGYATDFEIYGTCDDSFIYPEKIVWHSETGSATYTYTPEHNNTALGKISFDNWVNSLDYKEYYIGARNVVGSYYRDIPFENSEAESMCKELSEKFRKNTVNIDEITSTSDIKYLSKFFIEKSVDIGDGNIVSSVYLCRPLQIARSKLTGTYIGCAVVFAAWLVLAVCIICYKKRESNIKPVVSEGEVKEVDAQYEK